MDEKYYAYLMQRVILDDDLFVCKPISLLEGIVEDYEDSQIFATDDNGYYFADDIMSLDFAGDMVVHCAISESELLETYKTDNIAEAKAMYSDEVFKYIYFGTAVYAEEEYVIIKPTCVEDLLRTIVSDNEIEQEATGKYEEGLLIDANFFDSLLEIKTNEELRSVIEEYATSAKQAFAEAHDEINKKNSDMTKNLFDAIYGTIININDMDVMKKLLVNAEETYTKLISDANKFSSKNKDEATKILKELSKDYKKLQSLDNVEEIKIEIEKLKDSQIEKIERLSEIYYEEQSDKNEIVNVEQPKEEIKNVRDIKKYFDEKIIGQEEAKRDIISAIYMNKLLDDPSNKNNCLLVGPTGSGKTLIAETVGEFYDMPVEIIDTTQLTMPGYVGANIEDFLERLVAKAKGDLKKAEEGIVVFDEIDKKGSRDNSDVSGKGVLNTLLPFIGGTTYDITYNSRKMQFDTSKLTIFATGAFTDLAKGEAGKDYSSNRIGFGSTITENEEDIKYKKLETEDYVKQGNIPAELIGRFSVITQLSGHTIESLRKILTESNASALLSEKKKLEKINIELKWTDGYLEAVAKKAIKLKTGARSLKSTVDASIKEVRWEILNNLDIYKAILLTEKTVEDNKDCVLIDYLGNSHNLKDILAAKDKTEIAVKQLVK